MSEKYLWVPVVEVLDPDQLQVVRGAVIPHPLHGRVGGILLAPAGKAITPRRSVPGWVFAPTAQVSPDCLAPWAKKTAMSFCQARSGIASGVRGLR
ncbi:hypothetical protein [Streptomyces tubercidicus]|uniref:hypothetical protein n=1 Tax=Streptomyces tubercidicus TaxID=47759 RepID=UPI003466BB9F